MILSLSTFKVKNLFQLIINYYKIKFKLDWIMPWLLFIIYICLGMNNELNAFYDYTLMHMLSGIVIGRVYVFLAYEKKLLAAN